MAHRFTKKDILTIPNGMSLFRLCLIPLIIWLYCGAKNYIAAVALIALSGLTDVLDGRIARRFNMVSDFGKVLDPVADKLTQGTLILCLISRYPSMWRLILLFCVKEVSMALMGVLVVHYTGVVHSANWYGKACTVILDTSMAFLVVAPTLSDRAVNAIILVCALAMLAALALYARFDINLLRQTPLWARLQKGWRTAGKILAGCLWIAVIAVCIFDRDKFSVDEVLRYTPDNPYLAAAAMMALFAIKSVTVVLYCGILYIADGILFPLPIAFLLNVLGTVIMVSVPYFIGRHGGRESADKILQKYPKAAAFRHLQETDGFLSPLIVRLLGVLPGDVVSLYFGACGTPYWSYLAASVLGLLPSIITLPLIGTSVSDVRSPQFILSVSVKVLCTVASIAACAVLRARHKKAEANGGCVK